MKYQKAIIDTQFIYTNLKTRWKLDIKRLKKKAKHDHTGLWSPALDRLKKQDYKFKVRQGYRGRSYLKKLKRGKKWVTYSYNPSTSLAEAGLQFQA